MGFGLLIGFSTVMSKAGGELLNNFLGINRNLGIVIITIVVIAYSSFGGISATIKTDSVQFILFIILIPVLIVFAIIGGNIDINSFTNAAHDLTNIGFSKYSGLEIFSFILAWFFGEALIPPTINRILSSKSSKTSPKAMLYSGFFMIVWLLLMLTIGVFANLLMDIEGNDQVLLNFASSYYKHGFFGIFTFAMIGVIMSSQDSLINSAATVFTVDVVGVYKGINDKQKIILARISTVVIGICSIVFAIYLESILKGLLLFYSIWAPSILVSLVFSIILKNPSWKSALTSIITGTITSISWTVLKEPLGIPSIFIGLIVSLLSYYSVHLYVKRGRAIK